MFNVLAIEGNLRVYEIIPWCLDLTTKELSVAYDILNAFDTIEDEDIKLVVIGDDINYIPMKTLEKVINFTKEEIEKVEKLKNEFMPLAIKEFITIIRKKKNLPIPNFCIFTTGFYYTYKNSNEEFKNNNNQDITKRLEEENMPLFIKNSDNAQIKKYVQQILNNK